MNFFLRRGKAGLSGAGDRADGAVYPQVAKLQKKDGKLRVTVGYIPTPR